MQLMKTSSCTLQMDLTHETRGKQKVILSLSKILSHLKADYKILNESNKKIPLSPVKQGKDDDCTYIGLKFSNIL